ncbi:ctr copper transporter [Phlyctema vagabunda]|uniref:Copper transport protein n=1 Tax=Phlyctema vagabunda TaxID=108571 RepID=A0ABR4PJR8_9HELO
MNMASHTMDMSAATSTAAAAAATSTMDMDMDTAGCSVSMFWNWNTIDACFLSTGWRITSRAMFAGTCIGVMLLVILLEFLRRVSKDYDRYMLRQFERAHFSSSAGREKLRSGAAGRPLLFRPNLVQQATRATLHMCQFTVAYLVMLLAMYYNGYLIICILIGAWLGAFIFSWETVEFASNKEDATACCG